MSSKSHTFCRIRCAKALSAGLLQTYFTGTFCPGLDPVLHMVVPLLITSFYSQLSSCNSPSNALGRLLIVKFCLWRHVSAGRLW
jgi:hypothetical protein